MTLGRFMTNYLYIPMGGNRKGELKTLRNLFIVFLASGIWHGAGWNFVIWGMLHGICILIHRIWKNSGRKMNKFVGWFITMNLVNIFWVFFRATNLHDAIKVIKGMFDINNFIYYILTHLENLKEMTAIYRDMSQEALGDKISYLLFLVALFLVLTPKGILEKIKEKLVLKEVILVVISILLLEIESTFLYFNF